MDKIQEFLDRKGIEDKIVDFDKSNEPITPRYIIEEWNKAINYTHCCKSDSELLHTKVFNLANELAKAGYGNEAVRMHHICNGM